MKELLKQYAAYHLWATQKLADTIIALSAEQQIQAVTSSFSTLFLTLQHMWDAESIWWQRMKLQERLIIPSTQFTGTTQELVSNLLQQSRLWEEWVGNASDHALEHVFHYQNLKGEQFKQPIFQMLMHVFNHGTYHRGQLVTILRQLGVEKIPATDFIVYSRKK